jgi:hypothetical protein
MKIRSRILLFFLVTIGVMISFTTQKGESGNSMSAINTMKTDTAIFNLWLKVDSFDLSILPPSSGVQFYRDGIVFLSSSKFENKTIDNHISFGNNDAQYAVLKDTILENQQVFSPSVSFPYPCEALTFSSDYNKMYFTRYSKDQGVEKIYEAKYSSGEGNQGHWSLDENPVSFCSDKSIYTHPALSADGKLMIFASNRPGSIGGMDLFVTQFEGGSWSEPKNLGNAINSRANEMYPYLDKENNLFYSSDGLLGYGGYDIFVCKFKGNTWETPMNISNPVNTSFDDVAFTMDRKNGESAFYTVKEKSGKRSVKLLKVTMTGTSGPDKMTNLSQFFTNPEARNVVMIVTEPAVEATDRRVATDRSRGKDDNIVYRIQILTSFNPKTRQLINLEGKDYIIYEYLYSGAYRLCVGEFSAIAPAIELRNKFIQNDYTSATVVVFRNNVRSFDPDLLEEAAISAPVAPAEKPKAVVPAPVVQVKEEPKKEVPVTETRKPEPVRQPVKEPVTTKTEPSKTTPPVTETKPVEAVKTTTQPAAKKTDVVVYRVQFASNTAKKGSYSISIGGKNYNTWEYQYSGAYRSTVGEFKTLAEATAFQKIVRTSGYPQAFVIVFKNDVRSTDPALFK